jgi:hypothetical protein
MRFFQMNTDTPETKTEPSNGITAPVINEAPTVPTKKLQHKKPVPVAAVEATPAVEPAPESEAPKAPEVPGLRTHVKVWTDSVTGQRFITPCAVLTATGLMVATAISESGAVRNVTLTAAEWNSLPFFFFKEDGEAPRRLEKLSAGGK